MSAHQQTDDPQFAEAVVRAYYAAFNGHDVKAFLALLTDDVVHDINQGDRQVGQEGFRRFMEHMDRFYRERIEDLVVLVDTTGNRAAAEFMVHGTYIATDASLPDTLPPADRQSYVLPAGAFFTLRDGRVARISNYYNLADWMRQVSGPTSDAAKRPD